MAQALLDVDVAVPEQTQDDVMRSVMNEVFGEEAVATANEVLMEKSEMDSLLQAKGVEGTTEEYGEPSAKKVIVETESSRPEMSSLASGSNKSIDVDDEEGVMYFHRFKNSTPYMITSDGNYALGANG